MDSVRMGRLICQFDENLYRVTVEVREVQVTMEITGQEVCECEDEEELFVDRCIDGLGALMKYMAFRDRVAIPPLREGERIQMEMGFECFKHWYVTKR